ncbi:MAG TPA: amylo-alpha-1,6-glucosidase [Rhizomicrobium sp.]|jgi:glycogen debranching enzyme|nr:amylo-alpha-1,6-glucosidase [Rhizomicrobium sp.]
MASAKTALEADLRARADNAEEIPSFHIHATASIQERWPRTLKHGDMFGMFDRLGDIVNPGLTPGGLFLGDTRHLSELKLMIDGQRPLFLSSAIEDDNVVLHVDVSNPDLYLDNALVFSRETLHVRRSRFLWRNTLYERIAVRNFDVAPRRAWISLEFDADFRDLFEIRGLVRQARGQQSVAHTSDTSMLYSYKGRDGVTRTTAICVDRTPTTFKEGRIDYKFDLAPCAVETIIYTVHCENHEAPKTPFSIPYRAARREAEANARNGAHISCADELPQKMFNRAGADLRMLISKTEHGLYPYAGTPWFTTPFGRDGIITALQTLWLDPSIAKGVLTYLAATQATENNPKADAQPGKILHETRQGEMAKLGEVPFGQYYGSVDSTPLFILLAARYFDRTSDIETLRKIWPNIEAAIGWIDNYGDPRKRGFTEYFCQSHHGLVNQGWKDSQDSVFHADGSLVEGPVALCEVQGYVYAAKKGLAPIARHLGDTTRADALDREAEELRQRFEEKFWCEELGTYAIALDGEGKPCRVPTSNAGQVLYSGIASQAHAKEVAHNLMKPEGFSGWGIRTLGAGAPRYNPMSYHNGSIWPHDNALIALGFARYGLKREAALMFEGMFDVATRMDLMRLPELFCGFPRRRNTAPTLYPVACSPQAWASVVPFAMLEACLGLWCDFEKNEVQFYHPMLPRFLNQLTIRNLSIGKSTIDLKIERHDEEVLVTPLQRIDGIEIKIVE